MEKHILMSAHGVMVLCPMEQVASQACLAPHSARAATSAHRDAIPTGASLPKHLTWPRYNLQITYLLFPQLKTGKLVAIYLSPWVTGGQQETLQEL